MISINTTGNALDCFGGILDRIIVFSSRLRAAKLKLVSSTGFNRTTRALCKPSKRALTSLAIPGHDPPFDLTIFVDISINPGPVPFQRLVFNFSASHVVSPNLHTGRTLFSASRTFSVGPTDVMSY